MVEKSSLGEDVGAFSLLLLLVAAVGIILYCVCWVIPQALLETAEFDGACHSHGGYVVGKNPDVVCLKDGKVILRWSDVIK